MEIIITENGNEISTVVLYTDVVPQIGDTISYFKRKGSDRIFLIIKNRALHFDQYGHLKNIQIK